MPKKFISNSVLREVLALATEDERLSLTKIIDKNQTKSYSYVMLQKEICEIGGHGIVNIFRGQGTGYLDILDEVSDELNIKTLPSYSLKVKYFEEIESLKFSQEVAREKGIEYAEKAEEEIILKLLEQIYEQFNDDQKEEFDKQINKIAQKFDSTIPQNLAGTAGLIVLGNLGGFATYTFLTTALSTISMGTLGFGAYTAATSLLSIALGPAGWAALGLAGIFMLGKPEYKKLIPIVAIIGAIRQRIKYDSNTIDPIVLEEKEEPELNEKCIDLFDAVKNNNVEQVKSFLKNGIDLNTQNEDGYTALMIASFNNYIDLVKLLLEKKAKLNILTTNEIKKYGETALMLAAKKDHIQIVEILAKTLITIDFKNHLGLTALHLAVREGNLETIKVLNKNNVDNKIESDEGFTPFMLACYLGDIELVRYMLKFVNNINTTNKKGFTALTWSCFSGEFDVVKFLIANDAIVDNPDKDGFSPLMWSSLRGNAKVVKVLISKGANPNLKNKDGYTPLIWASIRGHLNIVKFLLENNADSSVKANTGKTALDYAKEKQHHSVVNLFNKNIVEDKKIEKTSYNTDKFRFNNFKAFGNDMQTFSKKHITLIYGPNSVGKSTLINVFVYLKSLQLDNEIDIQSTNKFGDEIDIGGIEQFIHKRDKNNIINLEVEIKDYDNEIYKFFEKNLEDINLKISYKIDIKNLLMTIEYQNNNKTLATKKVTYNTKNSTYATKGVAIDFIDDKYKELVLLLDKSQKHKIQYIGPIRPNPERNYDYSYENEELDSQKLWALLTNDRVLLNEVNKKLKLLSMNYEIENYQFYKLQDDFNSLINQDNLSQSFDNYKHRLENMSKEERLVFKDLNKNDVEVSNRDLGQGISQILPIVSASVVHKNTTIIIEQPELHLHPKLQMELADEFIRSHKENNNQFMIETHSENLLLRILKRIRYTAENKDDRDKTLDLTQDDVCLLYVDNDGKSTYIKELRLSKKGTLLDHWPNGFFEEGYKERFA